MSPTLSIQATYAGVILGTAAYMSPEQARGKPVDRRTDVWAFGCMLFEMLTGKQVFESAGDTVSDAVAAVLMKEPDWTALPADTPPHIERLLRRCLEKDLKKRLPHIAVARFEIDEPQACQCQRQRRHLILQNGRCGSACCRCWSVSHWPVWERAPSGGPGGHSRWHKR